MTYSWRVVHVAVYFRFTASVAYSGRALAPGESGLSFDPRSGQVKDWKNWHFL